MRNSAHNPAIYKLDDGCIDYGKKETWASAMLQESLEEFTSFHREPSDVKIKVTWQTRVFRLFVTFSMLMFILYEILTTNMFLDERIPMGDVSHWADGEANVIVRSRDQAVNSTLCKYDPSYDYLYGLDSIWNYRGARCEFTSPSELFFKGTQSLHFVTYEHQRKEVKIPRRGESCDEECQTVYPEWPSEKTYKDKNFLSVHVASEGSLGRRMNSSLGRVLNVHMMKPTRVGFDMCRCYSVQNVFHLGIDSAELHFTYSYDSPAQSGSSKLDNENTPIGFIFGSSEEKPVKIIPRGKEGGVAKITVEEALAAVGTCLDCQPEGAFFTNSLCPDAVAGCSAPHHPKPMPRTSGIQISLQTEYYSHKRTMPKGGIYDWVTKNYEPPYAIHRLRKMEDWTSRGSDITLVENTHERVVTMDKYRYGVLVRLAPATGTISQFDLNRVVTSVCNITVLMGFPSMIVSFWVFYLLGRQSRLYRRGQRKYISLQELYRSFAYQAMMANQVFKNLDANGSGFIDMHEIMSHFNEMLLPHMRARFPNESDQFYKDQMEQFVALMVARFDVEGEKNKRVGVSHAEFIKYCTSSEAMCWDDILDKLADPDIDLFPGSKLLRKRAGRPQNSNKVAPAPCPIKGCGFDDDDDDDDNDDDEEDPVPAQEPDGPVDLDGSESTDDVNDDDHEDDEYEGPVDEDGGDDDDDNDDNSEELSSEDAAPEPPEDAETNDTDAA
eukprot:gnl/TRDRNA2_/TRDRNA2_163628_c3_seq1.p1 gnl/TRDRNA2_/TRDRNA2_163628_c3~~gnl/TRDRNA2_/TRDRNA2_163628_c3_seq1.p1  ORF type:complete len:723 (-),score=110.03 gnl/TRDRNA2_/TRDRNA2_163628_c3_seq1:312-2480(-)